MSPAGKALVVGATGMIGSRVCERLAQDGWQTVGVCRTPPADTPGITYLPVNLLLSFCRSRPS